MSGFLVLGWSSDCRRRDVGMCVCIWFKVRFFFSNGSRIGNHMFRFWGCWLFKVIGIFLIFWKRKNFFKESYISRHENFICLKVKDLVTFLACRVAYEYAWFGLTIKFISVSDYVVNIGKRSEHLRTRIKTSSFGSTWWFVPVIQMKLVMWICRCLSRLSNQLDWNWIILICSGWFLVKLIWKCRYPRLSMWLLETA